MHVIQLIDSGLPGCHVMFAVSVLFVTLHDRFQAPMMQSFCFQVTSAVVGCSATSQSPASTALSFCGGNNDCAQQFVPDKANLCKQDVECCLRSPLDRKGSVHSDVALSVFNNLPLAFCLACSKDARVLATHHRKLQPCAGSLRGCLFSATGN